MTGPATAGAAADEGALGTIRESGEMIRAETPPEPPRVSIRQRISLAMVLLAVFVLAATGTLVFLLEGRSIERRVADDLELNRQEFVV